MDLSERIANAPVWVLVRKFGEQQLLTRASYLSLLIVPLVAGVWPTVRVAVNSYNGIVLESRDALNDASKQLEDVAVKAGATSEAVEEVLNSVNSRIEKAVKKHAPHTLANKRLPDVWGVAFFSSLFVMIGHAIYSGLSPDVIRSKSKEGHIDASVRDYRDGEPPHLWRKVTDNLPNAQDSLLDSLKHIDETISTIDSEIVAYQSNPSDTKQSNSEIDRARAQKTKLERIRADELLVQKLRLVGEAAEAEYDSESRSRRRPAWLAFAFYVSGFLGLIGVVGLQALAVYRASTL